MSLPSQEMCIRDSPHTSRTQRVRQNHHAAYHRRFRDAYVGRCPVRWCEDCLLYTSSHSHRRSKRTWKPNVKRVKAIVNGSPRHVYVCTRCMRSGKVTRACLLYTSGHRTGDLHHLAAQRQRAGFHPVRRVLHLSLIHIYMCIRDRFRFSRIFSRQACTLNLQAAGCML